MQAALSELATRFADIAERITPEQLDRPTPCPDYTVGALLAHLGGVLSDSERAARREPRPAAPVAPPTDPVAVARAAERASAAWLAPEALGGTTEFGSGTLPAEVAAAITLQEMALHGWDLAQGTGLEFRIGEQSAKTVLGVVEQLAEQARANGSYGPPVDVPAGAAPFDRALGASGRRPDWPA
ncbi:TIGR03086 family metal-binding protein [Kitasatospora sp. NPDC057015]|uniref:TIGR03086 family metal-binding protein n=1 Tax=Kitasatospora sp. NPDC057015 TaxID=3346001 RepID=UPI0036397FE2